MTYPNAYTLAQANSGPYDNTNNPEAVRALAAARAAASQPVHALGRMVSEMPTPDRIELINTTQQRGALAALNNPAIAVVRMGAISPAWLAGFDLATGWCKGNSLPGPGQTKARDDLKLIMNAHVIESSDIDAGFAVGQGLQFGITKALAGSGGVLSGNPSVAAGQLVVNGVANSGLPSDTKAAAVSGVMATSSAASHGAAAAVAAKSGFWSKFKAFFGM